MLRSVLLLSVLWLSACQTAPGSFTLHVNDFFQNSGNSFLLLNNLTAIQRDFEHGRIMRARERVLALNVAHQDYKQAQAYLKQTIEPARRQVFLHYLHAAQKAEHERRWDAAISAYDQAKAVTIKPQKIEKKRLAMQWNLRQLRFDTLLTQRRKEDTQLFNHAVSFAVPSGVNGNDAVYARWRSFYDEGLEDRANVAYREAKRYLRKGLPEIAYIEIESYLRLQPDAARGQKILAEVKVRMSGKLTIVPVHRGIAKARHVSQQRKMLPDQVTAKQIDAAVRADHLLYAEQMAQAYRRNHGKHADKLLAQVREKLDVKAADLFAKGDDAFGQENLDDAMKYWRNAVVLRPDQAEYREALRRARQLKERLVLLRGQKLAPVLQKFTK